MAYAAEYAFATMASLHWRTLVIIVPSAGGVMPVRVGGKVGRAAAMATT